MEESSVGSDDDGKSNVCPICNRTFTTIAGLKQQSHSSDEIDDIVATQTQRSIQQSGSLLAHHFRSSNATDGSRTFKNTFQVVRESHGATPGVLCHQFEVIENDATGDCLFTSVWQFLKRHKTACVNMPVYVVDLRLRAVNHIRSDFNRFQSTLTENLREQVPSFQSDVIKLETVKDDYVGYMSAPRTYGTTTELCALAEIFNFGFCVIRSNDDNSYSCYDYGSVSSARQPCKVVHLLFNGNVDCGHFRLLLPSKESLGAVISPGRYKLVREHLPVSRLSHQ